MTNTPPATIHLGDCIEVMRTLPENSVDAIVTDPPYGLGFMGKAWDELPPGEEWARECLRVLKPGGHLLAFGGSRTWHRLAVAVEDAGFEVRDSIAWLYGSGFPKSLDVSKAIDKAAGAEREVVGSTGQRRDLTRNGRTGDEAIRPVYAANVSVDITAPATPAAQQWQGWGTALKPAFEPIVVARKPLIGTVAANVLAHGTGALNIDGCRVGRDPGYSYAKRGGSAIHGGRQDVSAPAESHTAGRWPANVVLDESQAAALDEQSGVLHTQDPATRRHTQGVETRRARSRAAGSTSFGTGLDPNYADEKGTGASRFFYVAKAPTRERPKVDGVAHPTVKPLALMRWLVRLVTPPGGTVLEPFAGSGTTVEACALEGFACIAIEREPDYLPLIQARLARVEAALPEPAGPSLFDIEATA